MPGLKELSNFRDQLSRLGHEREITAARGEVYEELPLPPDPMAAAAALDVEDLLAGIGEPEPLVTVPAPEDTPEQGFADTQSGSDLEDFDSFLSSLPLDSEESPKTVNQTPEMDSVETFESFDSLDPIEPPESFEPTEPLESIEPLESFEQNESNEPIAPRQSPEEFGELPVENDDFSIPEDLLSGFADEISAGRLEEEDYSTPTIPNDFDITDMVIGDSEHSIEDEPLDLFSETPSEISSPADSNIPDTSMDFAVEEPIELTEGDMSDFSLDEPVELTEGDVSGFSLDENTSPPETDLSGFSFDEPLAPSGEDLPILEEMDFTPSIEFDPESKSTESSLADLIDNDSDSRGKKYGEDFADFSVPDDLVINGGSDQDDKSGNQDSDGFDGFSLDTDFLKNGADASNAPTDEFHIPGFSDFTSGPERPALSEFPSEAGTARPHGKKTVPLSITDSAFQQFLDILKGYPLNLRIAIEEYLAGDAGTEIQKMTLVNDIIGQVPIRRIARMVESAIDKSIPIPKDFERKSFADYELEKSSLKYVFLNKILPAATLFTIAGILAICTIYLSIKFIYNPLAAESLYKRGYAAIEDDRFTQSVTLFDEAVQLWNSKKWYFKYARAYRGKKQYISAEMMYTRILDRFNNDKEGGLEYAEMLRTELRNFSSAENILKRRLLDFYVNDPDGLLLLGDTYLDWAEDLEGAQSAAKYEDARRTYASLMELYGRKDVYLARMMRYFIRTDNLAEVLPLKEHFMEKGTKIGGQDLVELSGYFIDKRYEPKPGDTEFLREKIEDVRILLDRALKEADATPEAHYNIGRFLIYNYKTTQAITALSRALQRFDEVTTMSPKRVLTQIDTFRLLGEQLAENKEYLNAQSRYTDGIVLYETQRENRTIKQDPRVGKMYADYADIDYFISGDMDAALFNYNKAAQELHDVPSVRYRIGYIEYQRQDYESAMTSFTKAHSSVSDDKNLIYSYANTLFRRGDFFAAQGYYEQLMEMLNAERLRKGVVFPQINPEQQAFVEQYMNTSNNLGVTLNRISSRTADSRKNARALSLLSDSLRAWDALTRNQETMIRMQGSNLAALNIKNMTHPKSDYVPEIFTDIPRTLENEKILQQRQDQ